MDCSTGGLKIYIPVHITQLEPVEYYDTCSCLFSGARKKTQQVAWVCPSVPIQSNPRGSDLLRKLTVGHLVKKRLKLYGIQRLITVPTGTYSELDESSPHPHIVFI